MYGQVTGKHFSFSSASQKESDSRWQQAPDGIKGHEPQYWVPMNFHDDGTIDKLTWIDEFTLDV